MLERRGKDNPYQLKTPPGTSEYEMYFDNQNGKEVIVCRVGSTTLLYNARCIDDVIAMLKDRVDWMDLGGADEQKKPSPTPWKPGDARQKTPLEAGTA
ncbi:MAG TPA: hypothetical protein VG944_22645 [Fimbriimonas sp.]|nr:hypothetical protein [Fimbriimonas sp.]